MKTTAGTLLGGRVAYAQPAAGFRSGIEPVLLAASVPARAGECVLEAGTGAGAGLLCLAARVAGITGQGWELDAATATLAARNAAANGFTGLAMIAGDIMTAGDILIAGDSLAPAAPPRFHHAFANPPYHAAGGTPSPDDERRRAKTAPAGLLAAWIAVMARALRPRGTLTLSVPAAMVPDCLAAFARSGCGSARLLPLWPRAGRPAKLVLLRARRGGRAPFRLLPGLVLHEGDKYSAAARLVLREGAFLDLDLDLPPG